MTWSTYVLASATSTVLLLAGSARAQGRGADSARQDAKDCRAAARIVEKGHPDKKETWAYGVLSTCADGAGGLASAWAAPPADADALHDLAASTVRLADRRIIDGVLIAVRNSALGQLVRRIAIDVLLSQYAPHLRVGDGGWLEPENTGLAYLTDQHQTLGEQPPTAADRTRIINAFRELSTSDPDQQVRRVAKMIVTDRCARGCDGGGMALRGP